MIRITKILSAVICGMILSTQIATAEVNHRDLYRDAEIQSDYLKQQIREHFPEPGVAQVMIAIAACEASGNPRGLLIHWESNGRLLPNSAGGQARGTFQVMSRLHAPDMERRGLDINNLDDYLTFVRYLYDRNNGYNDWRPSRHCWRSVQLAHS